MSLITKPLAQTVITNLGGIHLGKTINLGAYSFGVIIQGVFVSPLQKINFELKKSKDFFLEIFKKI